MHGLLETIMDNVTVVPASPGAAVYVGVNVVEPAVMEPLPFSDHEIVPLEDVASLTVAVPFEQMVWLPPAVAVGCCFTVIVAVPSVNT